MSNTSANLVCHWCKITPVEYLGEICPSCKIVANQPGVNDFAFLQQNQHAGPMPLSRKELIRQLAEKILLVDWPIWHQHRGEKIIASIKAAKTFYAVLDSECANETTHVVQTNLKPCEKCGDPFSGDGVFCHNCQPSS